MHNCKKKPKESIQGGFVNTTHIQTKYGDILYLPHPTSKKHAQMSQLARAAQFAPFAALTGHEDAIKETARLTDYQIDLSEDQKEKINEQLNKLSKHIDRLPQVTIVYFVPDTPKDGGTYIEYTGCVKKMDLYHRMLVMKDGITINLDNIVDITEIIPSK